MIARRWRLAAAVLAALLIAECGVLLLRPAQDIDPVPVSAESVFRPAELERARDYAGGQRLLGLGALAAQGVLLVLLVVRPPRRALAAAERLARGHVVPATALAGGGLILAAGVAALPFAAGAHERAVDFGKSTQSWGEWASDWVVSSAIAFVLAGLAAALFAALMRRFPRRWWLAGAGAVVCIEVLFVWLAPVVLAPVFNDYRELPAGRTRTDVEQLARRADINVGDVLVVDASRRTTSANAYVDGIGHTKRVVLYDTLLSRFTPEQVRLVVAHELGHVKHRDLQRGMLWVAIVAPGGMLVVMLLTRRWSARAGTRPGTAASMPAFALALAAVALTASLVSNQLSRAVEADADAYSLELTGEARQFAAMERRLARVNLTDPDPPDLYRFLFATHPSVVERLGSARAFEREQAAGLSGAAESAAAAGGAPR
jgi:STE24 endopeptidase